jgi:hypothetical protein
MTVLLVFSIASLSCGSGNHLVSIAVKPGTANLIPPQTFQLQAVGTYSNGTTVVLASATWMLPVFSGALTVSDNGLLSCSVEPAPLVVKTTVIATFADLSASAQVTCLN